MILLQNVQLQFYGTFLFLSNFYNVCRTQFTGNTSHCKGTVQNLHTNENSNLVAVAVVSDVLGFCTVNVRMYE